MSNGHSKDTLEADAHNRRIGSCGVTTPNSRRGAGLKALLGEELVEGKEDPLALSSPCLSRASPMGVVSVWLAATAGRSGRHALLISSGADPQREIRRA